MSANLFALNNLIARDLVKFNRTPAPVLTTNYTSTPGNILYIQDSTDVIAVKLIQHYNDDLIVTDYDNNRYKIDESETILGAMDAGDYYTWKMHRGEFV
jgi:hypothetical protein